jgi:hypothetical protein
MPFENTLLHLIVLGLLVAMFLVGVAPDDGAPGEAPGAARLTTLERPSCHREVIIETLGGPAGGETGELRARVRGRVHHAAIARAGQAVAYDQALSIEAIDYLGAPPTDRKQHDALLKEMARLFWSSHGRALVYEMAAQVSESRASEVVFTVTPMAEARWLVQSRRPCAGEVKSSMSHVTASSAR